MREWTDLDYAQAAIDMLPGSVEEIAEFLSAQGIKGVPGRSDQCPIAVWTRRWVGKPVRATGWVRPKNHWGWDICLPQAARDFIYAFDAHRISL